MKTKSHVMALGIIISAIASPYALSADAPTNTPTYAVTSKGNYKEISGKELKSWIDSKKDFQLVDARPKKFENDNVIPTARFLPYDSDPQLITKTLPSKDAIIVAYCVSPQCPASGYLIQQLERMGYKNIYKYTGGLEDWQKQGFSTQAPRK